MGNSCIVLDWITNQVDVLLTVALCEPRPDAAVVAFSILPGHLLRPSA